MAGAWEVTYTHRCQCGYAFRADGDLEITIHCDGGRDASCSVKIRPGATTKAKARQYAEGYGWKTGILSSGGGEYIGDLCPDHIRENAYISLFMEKVKK
jgi:hypothetical protein